MAKHRVRARMLHRRAAGGGRAVEWKIVDIIAIAAFLAGIVWLFRSRFTRGRGWLATVTPLASIIGSGFLISAPVLYATVAEFAPLAMLGLVALAFAFGAVLRENIRTLEPALQGGRASPLLRTTENLSDLLLAIAYVISISYYVYLLSAFVLQLFPSESEGAKKALSIAVLAVVAGFGKLRGLGLLQHLERISVNTKLAVILATFAALAALVFERGYPVHRFAATIAGDFPAPEAWLVVLSLLLMVQGFETSRYLGREHPPELRIRTMRDAQLLSGAIYVVFVLLFAVTLQGDFSPERIDETSIIRLLNPFSAAAANLLILGAIMSQFSAAIADLAGTGGLLEELSRARVKANDAYLIAAALGAILILSTRIFNIIGLASKAFAFYYGLQTFSFTVRAFEQRRWSRVACGITLVLVCAVVLFWAKPFESAG